MPITIERSPRSMGLRPHQPDRHFAKAPEPIEIRPDDNSATLEQTVLKTFGAESLRNLPSAVAQNIIAIDVFDFPFSLKDRQSLLAYSFYVLGEGSFKYIRTYLKVTDPASINSLIDSVMDNPKLTDAYTKVDALNGFLISFPFTFSKNDIDRRKNIAKEVIRLQAQGLKNGEIIARRREILNKTNPNKLKI